VNEGLERFRKVLELERAKGYADTAVMGGLDRFLRALLESDRLPPGSAVLKTIRGLPTRGYHSLRPTERQRWLDRALATASAAEASPTKRPMRAQRPAPRAVAAGTADSGLDAPITSLKGVKSGLAARFARLGVHTIRDLLALFPRRHNDFARLHRIAELVVGEEQTVKARVWSADDRKLGRTLRGTEATVGDESGMMRVVWFNQPYLARQLRTNAEVVLSGRVSLHKGHPTFENPEWELWEGEDLTHTGRLVPVYPLTSGLAGRTVRRVVKQALDAHADALEETLPASLRQRLDLPPSTQAVRQMHYPDSWEHLRLARRRLAFDELLLIQLAVLRRRRKWQEGGLADPLPVPETTLRDFLASLPFPLTDAQQRSMNQILADLSQDRPMSRLLQGDVGSGKTVVATAAVLAAIANGRQAVMMAPTEILAEQHHRTVCGILGADDSDALAAAAQPPYLGRPLSLALLTGSVPAADKARLYEAITAGEIDVVIGTHALIQEGLEFARLGLTIVDEQHRFGVMQRAALREKASRSAHMLVMTATPIPRTLALTLYGDLDISVIDEMPPGRKPVKTLWAAPEEREESYDFVRRQVGQGRQCFVICPLVEESETLEVRAAVQEFERLRTEVFPDLCLELLHGRMSGREKDAAMRRFREGEADILVSTAVVEVGIDVRNATVMMVEGADRFGLAQLHQFRGRVGRGDEQAYCLLLSDSPSQEARQRLKLMEETTDGFRLAEADLEMRGPGEFFGTRQSGLPELKVARLTDVALIELARSEAAALLESDPDLARPEDALLGREVRRLEQQVTGEVH